MGKSAKKSTKLEEAVAVTAPVVFSGKGKRGAEKVIEKVSAKKLKKNDGTVQAIEKLKSETKNQKKNIKKKESSSSEDESSDEEEEKVKAVKPSTKNPTVATNGSAKKDKPISSSDSDSSDDSESEKDTKSKGKVIAPSAKKAESSSDDSSDDSDSEKDTKLKGKVIAPAKETEISSDSDSDGSSDSDEVPQAIQGKKVAPKADTTSSDSSSEEDNDKKTTVTVNKSSAAAKKKDDSSSDEDDDTSSDDSSEEDDTSKVAKVPITGSKNVPVASKDTESSDSSDDSESDENPAAKKPASANGKNSKQSEQSSEDEESSEDEDDDEDEKPSKGQKKNEDVEMVDAVTPKTVKKASQTPVTPQAQSGGSKTLFVGNLPFNVEQVEVENFFKDCKVAEVRFSSDRDGNFKGYGHVEFATEEDAQKALALSGEQLSGRELKLDMARERGAYTPGNERTPFQKAASAQGSTMFVGGIDRNGGEDEVRSVLEKHFAACGEITRVSIPPDRESGGLRGIAYIDFVDSGSLNKALELGGPEYNGYPLKVDEAKPRDNSGSQRSFGGGRDGGGRSGGRFGRSGGRDGGGRSGGRFGRSGGRDGGGRSGGRGRGFNKPNLAAAGTGKKTTFDD